MDYGNFIEKYRKNNTEAEQRAKENEARILAEQNKPKWVKQKCTCNTDVPCKYHDMDIIQKSRADLDKA